MSKTKIIWTIEVQPMPHASRTAPIRALRWLLKRLGRNYGLRCISVSERVTGDSVASEGK